MHNWQGCHAFLALPETEAVAYLRVMPMAARHDDQDFDRSVPCRGNVKQETDGAIVIDSLVTRFRSWRKYRSTYEELMKLSSRELDDLGISRSEIPNIARRVAL